MIRRSFAHDPTRLCLSMSVGALTHIALHQHEMTCIGLALAGFAKKQKIVCLE